MSNFLLFLSIIIKFYFTIVKIKAINLTHEDQINVSLKSQSHFRYEMNQLKTFPYIHQIKNIYIEC